MKTFPVCKGMRIIVLPIPRMEDGLLCCSECGVVFLSEYYKMRAQMNAEHGKA